MENQDRMIKVLACGGKVSIIVANTTYLVEQARKLQDLSPVATAALGRTLTIASMMAVNMKNKEDKLTIQIKGKGPIGGIVVVADYFPRVKGYVQNPLVDLPIRADGKLDVGGAVGNEGFVTVIKDIGLKEPYIGMTPIISGEIAEDMTQYFAISEQTPCVVSLGVLVNKEGVRTSGGFLITVMPDATETEIEKLEQAIKQISPITQMLETNSSLEEIAKTIIQEEEITVLEDSILPIYECGCKRERIEEGLLSLGKKELNDIIQTQGNIETVCHFCNQTYSFSKQELEELIKKIE